MQSKLLKLRDVQAATCRSRSSIYNGVRDGTFPRPVKIGTRAIAWRADDIAAWIDSRPTAEAHRKGGDE